MLLVHSQIQNEWVLLTECKYSINKYFGPREAAPTSAEIFTTKLKQNATCEICIYCR